MKGRAFLVVGPVLPSGRLKGVHMTVRMWTALFAGTVCLLMGESTLRAQVYSPGNGVTAPRVVLNEPRPRPASPVIVECVVDADGTLSASKVVRSGGRDDDQRVLDAVAQWRFEAGTKDGKPVAVRYYLSFRPGRE